MRPTPVLTPPVAVRLRSSRGIFLSGLAWLLIAAVVPAGASAQMPGEDSPPGDRGPIVERREPAAAAAQLERLRTLVYRRPQSTATFDRWHDLARQSGDWPRLAEEVRAYRREHPDDAAAQMVAGLASEKAREWPEALEAWSAAAKLAPGDYFPAARRAELLLRRQEFAAAGEALAAALMLDMPPAEFQRLARQQVALSMRASDAPATARVLELWRQRSRDDAVALREIAQRYQQVQRDDEASRTWQQLATLPRAPADLRFEARLRVALLQARQGEPQAARDALRKLLREVEPQGTRAVQLRQAINATFVEAPGSNDNDRSPSEGKPNPESASARADFWKAYSDENPTDLASRVEWSDALADAGNLDAALDACRESLLRAPNDRSLRERMVKHLVQRGDYEAAAEELQALAEQSGGDWSLLVEAGRLRLHRSDLDDATAQREAVQQWQQAVDRFPREPLVARAVGDACHEAALGDSPAAWEGRPRDAYPEELRRRRTVLWEAAEAQYREAARRDPAADHGRQLARLLHRLARGDEAVAAWREAASAAPESVDRWLETSGELARAGYGAPALEAAERATHVDPKSLPAWTRWLELCIAQNDLQRAEDALAAMRAARPSDPAWQMEARQWRARLAVVSQRAISRLEELSRQLQPAATPTPTPDAAWVDAAWEWLLLREATGELTADDPVLARLASLPASSPQERLRLAVLMQEANRLDDAVRLYGEAAALRGAPRKEIYRRWTELELRRGRPEAALAVAQRLARELPRDVEARLLLATVLGRQGDRDAQVETLRAAIDIAPRDIAARRQLASLLREEGRAEEARLEVLEAIRQSRTLAEMESLLVGLAAWARSASERDEVAEALRGMIAADPQRQEERSQALALWLEQSGDPRAALQQLEDLQSRKPLDATRLRKVVELARQVDAHDVAIRYQQQLGQLNPSPANRELLAQLYRQAGRLAEASAIWDQLLDYRGTEEEAARLVDDLVTRSDLFGAQRLVEAALTRHATSWRLAYRAALIHVALGQTAAARPELMRLLRREPEPGGIGSVKKPTVAGELELLEWVVRADMRLRMARWKRAQGGRDRERDSTRYFAEELMQPLEDPDPDRARIACALIGLRLLPGRVGRDDLLSLAAAVPGDATLQRAVVTALWIDGDATGVAEVLDRVDGATHAEGRPVDVWPRVLRLLRFGDPVDLAGSAALRRAVADWDWLHQQEPESAEVLHAYLVTRVCMAPGSRERDDLVANRVRGTANVEALAEWIRAVRYVTPELLEPLHTTLWDASQPSRAFGSRARKDGPETARTLLEFALLRPEGEDESWRAYLAAWTYRLWASEHAGTGETRGPLGEVARAMDRLRGKLREDASLEEKQREGPALGLAGMGEGSPFLDRDAVADLRRMLAPPGPEWNEADAGRTLRVTPAPPTSRDRTRFPAEDGLWSDQGLQLLERVAAAFPEATPARAAYVEEFQRVWREQDGSSAALEVALASLDWWWNDRAGTVTRLERLVAQEPASSDARLALARACLNSDRLEESYDLLRDGSDSRSWSEASPLAVRDRSELMQAVWARWSERLHERDLQGHAGAVTALAADPRGQRLASVGVDGVVRIWDPATGSLQHALQGHQDMLMSVAFAHDGAWIASAGYDRAVRRWDATTGRLLATLDAHSAVVRALAIAPDGKSLASGGDDGQLILWDTATGQVAERIPVNAAVQSLAYANEGRQLVALLVDGQLAVWRLNADGTAGAADTRTPRQWSTGVQPARALALLAPDAVAVAGENGAILVGKRTGADDEWREDFALPSSATVRGLAYCGSSATLSVGSEDQLVHVWDLERRKEALVLKGHTGRVLAVATPADGRWLASSGFDGTIKIWRLRAADGSSDTRDP